MYTSASQFHCAQIARLAFVFGSFNNNNGGANVNDKYTVFLFLQPIWLAFRREKKEKKWQTKSAKGNNYHLCLPAFSFSCFKGQTGQKIRKKAKKEKKGKRFPDVQKNTS